MKNIIRLLSLIAVVSFSLVACTPEDGEIGPTGPAGSAGPAGADGINGTNGTNGTDGTNGRDGTDGRDGVTNISSNVYLVSGGTWTAGTNTITVPEITKEVAQKGAVYVFQNDTLNADSTTWRETPYRFVGNVNGVNTFITVATTFQTGQVNIFATTSQNQFVSFSTGFDMFFRVVVIPPANKISGFKPETFEEVRMVYGLKD